MPPPVAVPDAVRVTTVSTEAAALSVAVTVEVPAASATVALLTERVTVGAAVVML